MRKDENTREMQRRMIAQAVSDIKDGQKYIQPGARRISAIEKPPRNGSSESGKSNKPIYIIPVGGGNVK